MARPMVLSNQGWPWWGLQHIHLTDLGGVSILDNDEVVLLEEGPPLLQEIQVPDPGGMKREETEMRDTER